MSHPPYPPGGPAVPPPWPPQDPSGHGRPEWPTAPYGGPAPPYGSPGAWGVPGPWGAPPPPPGRPRRNRPSDPAARGDDPGLDGYAQRCHEGLMSACDDLYELSEPMSAYEQHGLTCGGRVKPFEVVVCTDLGDD